MCSGATKVLRFAKKNGSNACSGIIPTVADFRTCAQLQGMKRYDLGLTIATNWFKDESHNKLNLLSKRVWALHSEGRLSSLVRRHHGYLRDDTVLRTDLSMVLANQ